MHGTQSFYDPEVLDYFERLAADDARHDFLAYRRFMRPKMKVGWFIAEVAVELQKFFNDWRAGKAPILLLFTPPQHGKSWSIIDFISWLQGHYPDSRAIFASFSDRLGVRANLSLQRWYMSRRYQLVFPELNIAGQSAKADQPSTYLRNTNILEYVGYDGSFRNTTVNGPINGEGLDLGVVDDPIKSRAEANSKLNRDKTWEWLTDDFLGRFSEEAGLIMLVTRWHVDDPAGRMIEKFGKRLRVLTYPAIAVKDEEHRRAGEPLFPELKSKEFLLLRKSVMSQSGWESEYQQSPIVVGGGMFLTEKFKVVPVRPSPREIRKCVRYWDKAGTEGGGAFTAGVRMDELRDGRLVVSDVRRGQWSTFDRETRIRQTAEVDNSGGYRCETWVEQEPGSGGKESAERTVLNLRGFMAYADRVTGAKETRAEPYSAQQQAGNVSLVAAPWNQAFIDEHETAPNGKYKDQWDAAAGAFMKVTGGSRFDIVGALAQSGG